MKLNSKYFTIAVYALAVLAFTVVFLLLGLHLGEFTSLVGSLAGKISSIFYAIVFALVLLPFVKLAERLYTFFFCRKKEHPFLVSFFSILTVYLVLLGLIFVSVWFFIPAISKNFTELYDTLSSFLADFSLHWQDFFPHLEEWLSSFDESSSVFFADVIASVTDYIQENFLNTQNAGALASALISFVSGLVSQLADIFLGLIISVYLLASRRFISGICGKLVVAVFPEKFALKFVIFFKRFYTDFCAFASARVAISFGISAVVFVLSWIFGIPMFSVISLLLFFFQLFPAIGTVLGVVLASVIVAVLAPVKSLVFIPALIIVEVLTSRLFTPLFLPKRLRPSYGLSAVLVIVGAALFNLIGAFLAVPIYATLNVEIRSYLAHRLAKKHLPISNEIYAEHDLEDVVKLADEMRAKQASDADDGADGADTV